MKFNKVIAIPAIVLAAGISLTACGSTPARPNARPMPFITHTVTVTPKPRPPAATTAPPVAAPAPVIIQPAPAPVIVTQAPAPVAAPPAGSAVGNCGGGVSAGSNTSCAFARDVAGAYNGPGSDTEVVYSPVTGQSYTMYYTPAPGGDFVSATGGNNASVTFVYQP